MADILFEPLYVNNKSNQESWRCFGKIHFRSHFPQQKRNNVVIWPGAFIDFLVPLDGIYSLSSRTCYNQILQNPGTAICERRVDWSPWNVTMLPRYRVNVRAILKFPHPISWLRLFTGYDDNASYQLENIGQGAWITKWNSCWNSW